MLLRKRKDTITVQEVAESMRFARVGTRLSEHFRQAKVPRGHTARTAASKRTVTKLIVTETSTSDLSADFAGAKVPKVKQRKRASKPAAALLIQPDGQPDTVSEAPKRRKRASSKMAAASAAAAAALDPVMIAPPMPSLTPDSIADGLTHLSSANPRLAELIAEHGAPHALLPKAGSSFTSLASAIVFQQLATNAARTIHGRFLLACQCEESASLTPEAVLATPLEALRAAGLSGQKAAYIADLASHYSDGRLTDAALAEMSEDEMLTALTAVKGIGPWTAHMHMMFNNGRPDVLPVGDLGVRKGFQILFSLKDLPDAKQMEALAESWRPWRSLGCWYMWRLTEAEASKKRTPKKAKTPAKQRVSDG